MSDLLNEKPFDHYCRFGTRFTAARCDFVGGVEMHTPAEGDDLLRDVAEVIGFHAVNIWPRLNGFSGYDFVEFRRPTGPKAGGGE